MVYCLMLEEYNRYYEEFSVSIMSVELVIHR